MKYEFGDDKFRNLYYNKVSSVGVKSYTTDVRG